MASPPTISVSLLCRGFIASSSHRHFASFPVSLRRSHRGALHAAATIRSRSLLRPPHTSPRRKTRSRPSPRSHLHSPSSLEPSCRQKFPRPFGAPLLLEHDTAHAMQRCPDAVHPE